jgi:beta-galactosidase
VDSIISGSCITGGFPGLCLDNDDFKALAENFLHTLAERYKDHPGLGGYDIWNECNMRDNVCYCPGTAEKFREWLKDKYGDVQTLGKTWHRQSLAEWEYVTPPRQLGPYPDSMDWLQFRVDNAYRNMRWRADIIKSIDKVHPVVAHGVAASLTRMASGAADDWRAAAEVSVYGYTWGSSRHGDESWKQVHAVDLVRASSRGKPFWHAETYAGPLWMQRQVIGKPRDQGRIASPEDIRYWDMVSFMAGATGMMYLRWRPLLDGPLFGAFGPYGMDGSRTPRSDMVSKIAKWVAAPEQKNLWMSRPVKGDVGIVVIPETQIFAYAQQQHTDYYTKSMQGAYRGFFDNNIQADWVHIDDIDDYDFLYVPYPVMLKRSTADCLYEWVDAGGKLVMEGCPGYFGDNGHVGVVQPNLDLDRLFGARENYVEFTPDISDNVRLDFAGNLVWGGLFLQAYTPTTGKPVAAYEAVDGLAARRVAAVENTFGSGATYLIGSMVGYGHGQHTRETGDPMSKPVQFGGSPDLFHHLLEWAGKKQHVVVSDPHIIARLHAGEGGMYLWVANPTKRARKVQIQINQRWGEFSSLETLWGTNADTKQDDIEMTVSPRDVSILGFV